MKVTIVIGEICSGKTTFSSSFPEEDRVDVGSIVREITSTEERTFNQDLDIVIANRLRSMILQHGGKEFVIVGVRQISILQMTEMLCEEKGIEVEIIHLDVPYEIRAERYEKRSDLKDIKMTFELADKKDKELGLFSLLQYIKHRKQVKVIQNY